MMASMRVAVGGMAIECCTFSPLLTEYTDFTILEGNDLLALYPFLKTWAEIEWLPLVRARALPGGPVRYSVYERIKARFLNLLANQLPLDGVYLDLHGAMYVEGMEDAEGDWIAAVRHVVGADCLIAASYDLHGNVSQRVIDHVNLLTAYRTAPHIDVEATRERACRLLVHFLTQDIHPQLAFVSVPLLLPGEKATTDSEPSRELYKRIPALVRKAGIVDASILIGYAWADEPRTGASVVAVAENREVAETVARSLAETLWSQRHEFRFTMPTGSIDECIQSALNSHETPFFISDAGDNVTGGAVGDVTAVLERMLAHQVKDAVYASIVDAACVRSCAQQGVGAVIACDLGGKLDTVHGKPLPIRGRILMLSGTGDDQQAVIQVEGVKVIVTARRAAFTTVEQFSRLNIDLLQHKLVVVKLGYLFPELAAIARQSVLAFSPGAINPAIETLPYQRLTRSMFPLEHADT